jgi:hypothetical protein
LATSVLECSLHRKELADVRGEPPALAGRATLQRREKSRNSINLGFSPGENTPSYRLLVVDDPNGNQLLFNYPSETASG